MNKVEDYELFIKPSKGDLLIEGFHTKNDEMAVTINRSSVQRNIGSRDISRADEETEEKLLAMIFNDSRSAEVIGNLFLGVAERLRSKELSLNWIASIDE